MPELPEVQTIVDDLNKKILGRKIIGVWFDNPKILKRPRPKYFEKLIRRARIKKIERRGKNILIHLECADKRGFSTRIDADSIRKNQRGNQHKSAFLLLIHQKMTGHLLIGRWKVNRVAGRRHQVESLIAGPREDRVNKYIRLIFYLDNNLQLGLSDLRRFAKVALGREDEIRNLPDLCELGPDILDRSLKVSNFISLIGSKNRRIKEVLMDQTVIAGIGNIYSDEALWLAKINPLKRSNELSKNELKNLYYSLRQVLKRALKLRGTSISDFRDASGRRGGYGDVRMVYRREGERCKRCKTPIKRVKIGARSAHFCPKCQKIANG